MKIISIPKVIFNHQQKFLFDGTKYDLIGSIIFDSGIEIPPKTRLPSQLKRIIPGFTIKCRTKIIDSWLTLEIIKYSVFDTGTFIIKANQLLTPEKIKVVVIDSLGNVIFS